MHLADLLAARVPRYTSYPTAPHFNAAVSAPRVSAWLESLPASEALSLYVHIPFCDSLCWFCGCNLSVVNSYRPVEAYVDILLKEIDLVADALAVRRRVTSLHFGGGSPTILKPDDVARITDRMRARFDFAPDAEFAVEIDPRGFDVTMAQTWARAGATRASLGLQDVNAHVQRAVNRWQPLEVIRDAVARLREVNISALNLDLMYGLPYQTVDDVRRTAEAAAALAPQRIAVFGYAHVPDMKRHQKLIGTDHLPDAEERLRQYNMSSGTLRQFGFQAVGLDHFARPDDAMAVALRQGTLRRNFQGYTTDAANTLIGFGASAISSLPQGYAQNGSAVPDYRARILGGTLATARGRVLSPEDRVRRAVIERLMCDLTVDLDKVAPDYAFAPELAVLDTQGIAIMEGRRVSVPETMRVAVRLVASVFDAYLPQVQARHSAAV